MDGADFDYISYTGKSTKFASLGTDLGITIDVAELLFDDDEGRIDGDAYFEMLAEAGITPEMLAAEQAIDRARFASRAKISAIDELRSRDQWVCWKLVMKPGAKKPTKPPFDAKTGRGASHSDRKTWASYDVAAARAKRDNFAGVGYVLSDDDDLTGIDLDQCRDPQTGQLEPWADEIIALGETYAEISPSGTGIRLFARGKVDKATKCDPAHVEIYGRLRYLTVTERHVDGTPLDIRPAPRSLAALLARVEQFAPKGGDVGEQNRPQHIDFSQRNGGDAVRENRPSDSPSRFFRTVNDKALANLGAWVPGLFPRAKLAPSTGAYRITSKQLGRNLQEDLSIAPNGIIDFGVADMGDPQQGRRTPIDLVQEHGGAPDAKAAAFWLCDRLGKTPESFGWTDESDLDKIGDMIAAGIEAREREAASSLVEQEDGTIVDAETGQVHFTPEPQTRAGTELARDELPEHLTWPAGVLGEIVDWITESAQRPNRVLALGAAIAVLATIVGRRVAGPTLSGTHQYIIMLAKSAAGKDHPLRRANALLNEVNPTLVGPGEFTTQNALIQHVVDNPLSLCAMDELGAFMGRICNPRASTWERGATKVLREYWGASFDIVPGMQWAGRKSEPIRWPALSILGVSTQQEFFDALSSKEATNGFLNRFLMFSTVAKIIDVDEPTADRRVVPDHIKETLCDLYGVCVGDAFLDAEIPDLTLFDEHKQIPIGWADGDVFAEYRSLVKHALDMSESAVIGEIYGRTAEIALRLATIHAVSRAGLDAKITRQDFEWGRELALWSANTMAREASMRMSDTEAQARANRILQIVHAAGGTIKHRDLGRKLQHRFKPMELKDAITSLVESGAIERKEVQPKGGGTKTTIYILRELS